MINLASGVILLVSTSLQCKGMDMFVEITRELFVHLACGQVVDCVEEYDTYCKHYVTVHGVCLMKLTNYVGGVEQYYVRDINA